MRLQIYACVVFISLPHQCGDSRWSNAQAPMRACDAVLAVHSPNSASCVAGAGAQATCHSQGGGTTAGTHSFRTVPLGGAIAACSSRPKMRRRRARRLQIPCVCVRCLFWGWVLGAETDAEASLCELHRHLRRLLQAVPRAACNVRALEPTSHKHGLAHADAIAFLLADLGDRSPSSTLQQNRSQRVQLAPPC